jgi:uncharacterized protein (TIGR02118 family)
MIKLSFCLRRLPHLSRAEFQKYWREEHALLVASHAEVLGIRRYVQSHSLYDDRLAGISTARGSHGLDYDGVAELWFDSIEALAAAPSEAASLAGRALLEDEAKFIDLPNSPIFFVEEHDILASTKLQ